MEYELLFATDSRADTAQRPDDSADGAGYCDATERITALIDQLDRFVADETSRRHAEEALGVLGGVQTRLSSHVCDLTRRVTEANPHTDAVRILKQKARFSRREANRMAKVAERLPDLPRVAEGEITLDHAKAMADAADKVGPKLVDSDPKLLEEATRSGPDGFARKARDWSNQKLIEAGDRHPRTSAPGKGSEAMG